ncbi:MAG: LysR family transcriptional regulator, partial [Aeromicrobium sp.]
NVEIETRHLRLVKVVAEQGSITRAASVLGTTQPALTRQLRRVEENLGGPLFQRSRNSFWRKQRRGHGSQGRMVGGQRQLTDKKTSVAPWNESTEPRSFLVV